MPSEPAHLSEPTVWAAEQGMAWGIINSSVWSCWLILIEVNVRAEKYFDWWGWREAPPPRRPESLTRKAVRVTEGNSLTPAPGWRAGIRNRWRPQRGRSHYHYFSPPSPSPPWCYWTQIYTRVTKTHMATGLPSKNSGNDNQMGFKGGFENLFGLELTSRPKVSPREETGARVDFAEVADDEEEEWCSLSWWAV